MIHNYNHITQCGQKLVLVTIEEIINFHTTAGMKKQAGWKDYMYETSRGLVQQGVSATPYIHTASHPNYQFPICTVPSWSWLPTYFIASHSVDGVHSLGTQMGQCDI